MQLLGIVTAVSRRHGISHGEMTIAKFAYLLYKVYLIPTFYDYKRWHFGPFPPEIKKTLNDSRFFTKKNNAIEFNQHETLIKYVDPHTNQLSNAVDD
jgi:hypothetical protein